MDFISFARDNIVLFDGAMGTTIQNYNLKDSDFFGYPGCNEYLNICQKDLIFEIHANFFKAGAKVVETNTFGATKLVLSEYKLENKVYEINFNVRVHYVNGSGSHPANYTLRFVVAEPLES